MAIKLRKDVQNAFRKFNLRGIKRRTKTVITDQTVIGRIMDATRPGEDPNDTILHLLRVDGWLTKH